MNPLTPRPRESETAKPILQWLGLQGITPYRRNVGMMRAINRRGGERFITFGEPGQADYWFIWYENGRHCEMELKRLGEKPTKKQLLWLMNVNAEGGFGFWADNLESVQLAIENLKSGKSNIIIESDGARFYHIDRHYHHCRAANIENMIVLESEIAAKQVKRVRPRRGRREPRR